jgi:hypothetical protein
MAESDAVSFRTWIGPFICRKYLPLHFRLQNEGKAVERKYRGAYNELHGVTLPKTVMLIFTAVSTSSLSQLFFFVYLFNDSLKATTLNDGLGRKLNNSSLSPAWRHFISNSMLTKKIFRPKREEVRKGWRNLIIGNFEICSLLTNVINAIKKNEYKMGSARSTHEGNREQ